MELYKQTAVDTIKLLKSEEITPLDCLDELSKRIQDVDKSINALKYFDCKQKVSGTQLNVIDSQDNKNIFIFSSFDEKKYQLLDKDQLSLIFEYETQDYISSILIKKNLESKLTKLTENIKLLQE